jgi:hypothetical protein
MSSLNRHVGHCKTDGEALIDVVPAPKNAEVLTTLDWACNAMLGACVGVNQILGGTLAGQQLGHIAERYQALTGRPKVE